MATELTWEQVQADKACTMMELANWIHSLAPWQVIAHFTWRDKPFKLRDGSTKMCGVSSESARRYYEKFMAKNFPRLTYFYAIEPNPSRDGHHIHALFSDARDLYRKEMWELWFQKFGRNKVEKVSSKEDVVGYCAKYCTKAYTGQDGAWWNVKLQSHHWERIQGKPFELRAGSFDDFK